MDKKVQLQIINEYTLSIIDILIDGAKTGGNNQLIAFWENLRLYASVPSDHNLNIVLSDEQLKEEYTLAKEKTTNLLSGKESNINMSIRLNEFVKILNE